jgi:3-hydroxyisobutyrate dehydrogenase-like beta-hydroxyacid dehydrogenase
VKRLGFLGFGEVPWHLATGMRRPEGLEIVAFDPVLVDPDLPAKRQRAVDAGVTPLETVAGLADCELVLSLVTPAAAVGAAEAYAPHAVAGQRFIEMNSAAPAVKRAVDELLTPHGVEVDDAVLTGGGIGLDGWQIPVNVAGPTAADSTDQLLALGLNARAIGDHIGQAAAVKMLRGVIIKGLEGLAVEAFTAARAAGLEDVLMDAVGEALDKGPIADFLRMLLTTHTVHCGRRSVEVDMIRQTVEEAGLESIAMPAMVRLFERSAGAGLAGPEGAGQPDASHAVAAMVAAFVDRPETGES